MKRYLIIKNWGGIEVERIEMNPDRPITSEVIRIFEDLNIILDEEDTISFVEE